MAHDTMLDILFEVIVVLVMVVADKRFSNEAAMRPVSIFVT
jgi:hypothetical protein